MENLSEVLKILEAAVVNDASKAVDYGNLLASKLEKDQPRQAAAVRSRLSKASVRSFAPSSSSTLPIDDVTGLPTVDVFDPVAINLAADVRRRLVLHPYVEEKLGQFLDGVRRYDFWQAQGLEVPNRLLLHGPPGTGKTSMARRIARDLDLPLLVSRSDTLVSSLLGQTSKNIRHIFEFAQSRPCVLFLDEFDALAKARADAREIGELQRVVIALLQNIDALPDSAVLIAATNHPELLDRAVWRRFGETIRLDLPGAVQRRQLWQDGLADLLAVQGQLDVIVDLTEGLSPAAITAAVSDVRRAALTRGRIADFSLASTCRRIARFVWDDRYQIFEDAPTEMRALRLWAPKVFTVRELATEFDVSVRQVSNALKE